jgi:predicted kinase
MVVIVFGLPGSGKSYFATALAKQLHAEYVNSDRLRKEMFPVRKYSDEEKMAVYEKMRQLMNDAINGGKDIVLDATFHKEAVRSRFRADVKEKNQLRFIEVKAKGKLIRDRLAKPRAFSEADFKIYKILKAEWEPMKEHHLVLESNNNNIDSLLFQAGQYLLQDETK